MIIEQPEAFKTWLTAVLKPMCDADPAALAKYVLALVRKDKSEEELQKIMVSQLNVFLEEETESFVNLVLRTLESQDYITTPVIPNANPPNPISIKPKESTKPIIHPNELPNLNETLNGSSTTPTTTQPIIQTTSITTTTTTSSSTTNSKAASNKEKDYDSKRERESRKDNEKRTRHRSTSRNRSRSRSWDRSKRSRSREKDKRPRTWRNKSPPRRFERRNRTRSPLTPRSRSRTRSPPPKHRRYRNRTPPPPPRSRSRSPLRNSGGTGVGIGGGTPTQDSNHGDLDLRLTNSTQSIQSVVQSTTKRRCRDFDEKGYCMRGEMCPYDHGVDPVVLEDAQLSSVLTYNPNQQQVGEVVVPPPQLLAAAAAAGGGTGVPGGHLVMGRGGIQPEYNPQAPQMWNRAGFRGPRPMGMPRGPPLGFNPVSNIQRELIQVPVMDNNQQQGVGNINNEFHHHHHHHHQQIGNLNVGGGGGQFKNNEHDTTAATTTITPLQYNKKKQFDFNRLGPR